MRLKSCTFHNFGPFADYTLDLEGLGPDVKLVALVAPNGTGKSFSLETAMPGICYRKMPTNGTLVKRATARDSWVESRFHFGQDLKIRHLVDAVSGKSEAVVTNEFDQPLLPTTSVTKFEAWAAKNLPDQEVFFASIFSAQQSEGFVKMGSAERIDVILKVLGVARLERMAVAARKRRDSTSAELETLLTRIADARGGALTVQAAEEAIALAEQGVLDADRLLTKARQDVDAAEAEERRVADLTKAYNEAITKRAELQASLAAQREAVAKLELRITNNQNILANGDAIRAARVELDALAEQDTALALELAAVGQPFDAAAKTIGDELTEQQQRVTQAEANVRAAGATLQAARNAVAAAEQRVLRARARLADEAKVTEAAAQAEPSRPLVVAAKLAVEETERELAEARGKTLAGATDRIVGLRTGLRQVFDTEDGDASDIAKATLIADDAAELQAVEVPKRIAALETQLARERSAVRECERMLADLERLAARAPEMATARSELAAATDAEATALSVRDAAEVTLSDLSIDLGLERSMQAAIVARKIAEQTRRNQEEPPARSAIEAKIQAASARRAELVPLVAKYDHLVAAHARIAELEPQLVTARAELDRLAQLDSVAQEPSTPPPPPWVEAFRQSAANWERQSREAHGAVAVARQRLADAMAVDAKVAGLEADRARIEADLADWTRLALDFGRTGLQSAEVDSAGPELTELINDLLLNCHGPRFTVSVDTQRIDSTGHKLVDECRIQVIDNVRGTDKEIREHSGGERALLGEAVGFAMLMLACRRAGFDRPTLVRDESASACDPENARAWVAMCRRAIEFTGADRMVFISHSDEVIALADARIELPTQEAA